MTQYEWGFLFLIIPFFLQFCKGVVMAAQPSFMHKLYRRSFGLNKPLGLRLHITLNLEMCYLGSE